MRRLHTMTLLLAIGCSETPDTVPPEVANDNPDTKASAKSLVISPDHISAMNFAFAANEPATIHVGDESFGKLPVDLTIEELTAHFDPGLADMASSFERIEEACKQSPGGMTSQWNESHFAVFPDDGSNILLFRRATDDGTIAGGLRLIVLAEDDTSLAFLGGGSLIRTDGPWAPIRFGRSTPQDDK